MTYNQKYILFKSTKKAIKDKKMKKILKNFIFLVSRITEVVKYRTIYKVCKKNYNKFDILIAGISISGLIFYLWSLTATRRFFTNYNCIFIYMCLGFF
jgi:hypothetical protein